MSDLKVECPHCGSSLKLKDRSADGKKVRCPKCQEPFKVQLPVDDVDEYDDLDDLENLDDMEAEDDRYDDEDDAPRKKSSKGGGDSKKSSKSSKKKKGSKSSRGGMSPMVIGGIALGGVLVIGLLILLFMNLGGAAGIAALAGGGNKFDTGYLLPEHDVIVRVKLADVLAAPLLSSVVNSPTFKLASGAAAPGELTVMDIDSITVAFSASDIQNLKSQVGPPNSFVIVMRTKKPFDLTKGQMVLNQQEATHNGKKYYASKSANGPSHFAADANTLVMASEVTLKKVIDQGSTAARRAEFDFVDPDHQIMIAVAPYSAAAFSAVSSMAGPPGSSPGGPGMPPPAGMPGAAAMPGGSTAPGAAALEQFRKSFNESVQGISFVMDLKDGVEISSKLNCKDEGGAGAIKGQIDLAISELKSKVEEGLKNVPAGIPEVQQAVQIAQQTVSSINLTQSQKNLELKISVPGTLKALVDKGMNNPALGAIMGGMMGGGGPGMNSRPPVQVGSPTGSATQGFPMQPGLSPMPPGAFPMQPGGLPMQPGAFPMPPPGTAPMPMPASPIPM